MGEGKESIMETLWIIYYGIECLFKYLKKTKMLIILGVLKCKELLFFFWNNHSDP